MAIKISDYATKFAQILPYVDDKAYSVDQRSKILTNYINDGNDIRAYAHDVVVKFTSINNNMIRFVASFAGWAKTKEAAERAEVERINGQLVELGNKIGKLKTAQIATGVVAAAALPFAGIAAACFPPAAPFILISGAIVAGLSVGAMIGVTIALNALKDDKRGLENKRKELLKDADAIKAMRDLAEKTGTLELARFGSAIGQLSTIWQTAENDAQSIMKWLHDLETDTIPPILIGDREKVIGLYTNMAAHLRGYADGVQSAGRAAQ